MGPPSGTRAENPGAASGTFEGRESSVADPVSESQLILSCEHASNAVPRRWRPLFQDAGPALESHRGWDIGARQVAQRLARRLSAPLFLGRATRLLVDLNRSPQHPRLFSEWTRSLSPEKKAAILAQHYRPYRDRLEEELCALRRAGPVVHLSVHSFTPVMNERRRGTDLGLLYDPSRRRERTLVARVQSELRRRAPSGWRVHRNQPYLGVSDGLIPFLRRRHPAAEYVGIELELNQRHLTTPEEIRFLGRWVADGIAAALGAPLGR